MSVLPAGRRSLVRIRGRAKHSAVSAGMLRIAEFTSNELQYLLGILAILVAGELAAVNSPKGRYRQVVRVMHFGNDRVVECAAIFRDR